MRKKKLRNMEFEYQHRISVRTKQKPWQSLIQLAIRTLYG